MQKRKILTLEEVLNLDRRPTLQEMVDLSVEDYTKYLYIKGIIKYIPESGNVKNYDDAYTYNPFNDVVILLKNSEYMKSIIENELNESKNNNLNWCDWDNLPEIDIIYVDGNPYECDLNIEGIVSLYGKRFFTYI